MVRHLSMRNKVHKYSIFSFGTLIFCKKEIGLVEGTVPHIVRGDMLCCFLRRSSFSSTLYFSLPPPSLSLSLLCCTAIYAIKLAIANHSFVFLSLFLSFRQPYTPVPHTPITDTTRTQHDVYTLSYNYVP
jgi:hypothetical protein